MVYIHYVAADGMWARGAVSGNVFLRTPSYLVPTNGIAIQTPLIKLVLQCEFEYLAIQVRMGGNIVG